ncbi:DNA cytosine methyltransferase [Gammaproteobacteria bacterium]
MKKIKICNLYSCLGGNRAKWDEVSDIEVTAVELDPELARMYQERFPNDTVIIADAHQYLLDHYKEFDFIWSSPPCPSHSRAAIGSRKSDKSNHKPLYPDFKLYEEVIFLQNYFKGKFCVENVIPYYEPLIPAQKRGRHLYWTNFNLPTEVSKRKSVSMESKNEVQKWCKFHEYDFTKYKGEQRVDKIARNLVDFEAGKTIFERAMNIQKESKDTQQTLFV